LSTAVRVLVPALIPRNVLVVVAPINVLPFRYIQELALLVVAMFRFPVTVNPELNVDVAEELKVNAPEFAIDNLLEVALSASLLVPIVNNPSIFDSSQCFKLVPALESVIAIAGVTEAT
jgi:hypothetical protein